LVSVVFEGFAASFYPILYLGVPPAGTVCPETAGEDLGRNQLILVDFGIQCVRSMAGDEEIRDLPLVMPSLRRLDLRRNPKP